jgi:hypothetical protein
MKFPYNTEISDIKKKIAEYARKYFSQQVIPKKPRANIIVFDLDDTLITENGKLFYDKIFDDLKQYRKVFDYMVLWTHGTEDYLHEIWSKIQRESFKFDLYMARKINVEITSYNKGMAAVLRELNRIYSVESLGYTVLVDDKLSNYVYDYDTLVHITSEPKEHYYRYVLDTLKIEKDNFRKTNICNRIIDCDQMLQLC